MTPFDYEKYMELEDQVNMQKAVLASVIEQQESRKYIVEYREMAARRLKELQQELYRMESTIVDEWTGKDVIEIRPLVKVDFGGLIIEYCEISYDDERNLLFVNLPMGGMVRADPNKVAASIRWNAPLQVGEAWV